MYRLHTLLHRSLPFFRQIEFGIFITYILNVTFVGLAPPKRVQEPPLRAFILRLCIFQSVCLSVCQSVVLSLSLNPSMQN